MRLIRNERGGASILMLGLFTGIILMGFIFFDLTSVFMERRMSQTGSDAAAVAAAIEARKSYEEEVKEQVESKLTSLRARVAARKADWEEAKESAEESEEDIEVPTWGEVFADLIDEIRAEHENRSMPSDIYSYLWGSTNDVEVNGAMTFFWNQAELSNKICEAVEANITDIREEAQRFADLNGIENTISIVFPVEEEAFKIGIRAKGTINDFFLEEAETEEYQVPADAVIDIQQPEDVAVVCHS